MHVRVLIIARSDWCAGIRVVYGLQDGEEKICYWERRNWKTGVKKWNQKEDVFVVVEENHIIVLVSFVVFANLFVVWVVLYLIFMLFVYFITFESDLHYYIDVFHPFVLALYLTSCFLFDLFVICFYMPHFHCFLFLFSFSIRLWWSISLCLYMHSSPILIFVCHFVICSCQYLFEFLVMIFLFILIFFILWLLLSDFLFMYIFHLFLLFSLYSLFYHIFFIIFSFFRNLLHNWLLCCFLLFFSQWILSDIYACVHITHY